MRLDDLQPGSDHPDVERFAHHAWVFCLQHSRINLPDLLGRTQVHPVPTSYDDRLALVVAAIHCHLRRERSFNGQPDWIVPFPPTHVTAALVKELMPLALLED